MYNSMCDTVFLMPTVLIKIDDWGTMESSFRDLGTGHWLPKICSERAGRHEYSKCVARSRRPDWATGRKQFFLSSIWSTPCHSAAHSIIVHHADLICVPSLCSSAHSSVGGQWVPSFSGHPVGSPQKQCEISTRVHEWQRNPLDVPGPDLAPLPRGWSEDRRPVQLPVTTPLSHSRAPPVGVTTVIFRTRLSSHLTVKSDLVLSDFHNTFVWSNLSHTAAQCYALHLCLSPLSETQKDTVLQL